MKKTTIYALLTHAGVRACVILRYVSRTCILPTTKSCIDNNVHKTRFSKCTRSNF